MTKQEQVSILRAITKISSALNNIDTINIDNNPNFCGKMRRDLIKFCDFFCHHTQETTTEMYKRNKTAWDELVYYWFDGIDDDVEASTFEKKHISLFLSKCTSAINDLRTLENNMTNKIFAKPLISRFEEVLNKGYIKRFDVNKNDIQLVTDRISDVGFQVVGC
jgi:ATP-dependent exoDNAse (exonuclease V) beta subunit